MDISDEYFFTNFSIIYKSKSVGHLFVSKHKLSVNQPVKNFFDHPSTLIPKTALDTKCVEYSVIYSAT